MGSADCPPACTFLGGGLLILGPCLPWSLSLEPRVEASWATPSSWDLAGPEQQLLSSPGFSNRSGPVGARALEGPQTELRVSVLSLGVPTCPRLWKVVKQGDSA